MAYSDQVSRLSLFFKEKEGTTIDWQETWSIRTDRQVESQSRKQTQSGRWSSIVRDEEEKQKGQKEGQKEEGQEKQMTTLIKIYFCLKDLNTDYT